MLGCFLATSCLFLLVACELIGTITIKNLMGNKRESDDEDLRRGKHFN